MSTPSDKGLLERAMGELAARGETIDAPGIDEQEMLEVLKHPKAAPVIEGIITREEGSLAEGDDAPDFCLKPLDGTDDASSHRLSDHFGKRPVALVFGSYT